MPADRKVGKMTGVHFYLIILVLFAKAAHPDDFAVVEIVCGGSQSYRTFQRRGLKEAI